MNNLRTLSRLLMLLTLTVVSPYDIKAHGNHHFTQFTIRQNSDGYNMEVRFLNEDLPFVLDNYLAQGKMEEIKILNYLRSHFCLMFNKKAVELTEPRIVKQNSHTSIHFKLISSEKVVQDVALNVSCLIAKINEHINVLIFKLNGNERFFNLSKQRQRTQFNYSKNKFS